DGSLAATFPGGLTPEGVAPHIELGTSAAFDLASTVSLEAWVKPTASDLEGGIVGRRTPDGLAYVLEQIDGQWHFTVGGLYSVTRDVSATIAAGDVGAWVHLVGTFDGYRARLYKNGVLVATTTGDNLPLLTASSTGGFTRIGQWESGRPGFVGAIDE